jgi:hypothetical protein
MLPSELYNITSKGSYTLAGKGFLTPLTSKLNLLMPGIVTNAFKTFRTFPVYVQYIVGLLRSAYFHDEFNTLEQST